MYALKRKSVRHFWVLALALSLVAGCASKKAPETTAGSDDSQSMAQSDTSGNMSSSKKKMSSSSTTSTPSSTTLSVAQGVIATSMENLEPQGTADSFNANNERLYCYTKIQGGGEGAEIYHVWMHNNEELARVKLNVKGEMFRTYSSKIIESHRTGAWKVRIEDSQGGVIQEIPFQITSQEVSENQ